MGDIVGNVVGGIGSLFGSQQAAAKEDEAAKSAMTGYNYLASSPFLRQLQANSQLNIDAQNNATQAQGDALGRAQGTQDTIRQLLTSDGTNNPAFQNYLNSTGYNFQLQQGSNAITGNAAAKGLLNSGATAKALTSYGQNLAGTYFGNYLNSLNGLGTAQLNTATGFGNLASNYGKAIDQGTGAAEAIGQAGTTGGNNAGGFQAQAGQSLGTGTAQAFNYFGSAAQSGLPTSANFFGR